MIIFEIFVEKKSIEISFAYFLKLFLSLNENENSHVTSVRNTSMINLEII